MTNHNHSIENSTTGVHNGTTAWSEYEALKGRGSWSTVIMVFILYIIVFLILGIPNFWIKRYHAPPKDKNKRHGHQNGGNNNTSDNINNESPSPTPSPDFENV